MAVRPDEHRPPRLAAAMLGAVAASVSALALASHCLYAGYDLLVRRLVGREG